MDCQDGMAGDQDHNTVFCTRYCIFYPIAFFVLFGIITLNSSSVPDPSPPAPFASKGALYALWGLFYKDLFSKDLRPLTFLRFLVCLRFS